MRDDEAHARRVRSVTTFRRERERESERGRGSDWRRRSCRGGTQCDREGDRRRKERRKRKKKKKRKKNKKKKVAEGGLSCSGQATPKVSRVVAEPPPIFCLFSLFFSFSFFEIFFLKIKNLIRIDDVATYARCQIFIRPHKLPLNQLIE